MLPLDFTLYFVAYRSEGCLLFFAAGQQTKKIASMTLTRRQSRKIAIKHRAENKWHRLPAGTVPIVG